MFRMSFQVLETKSELLNLIPPCITVISSLVWTYSSVSKNGKFKAITESTKRKKNEFLH